MDESFDVRTELAEAFSPPLVDGPRYQPRIEFVSDWLDVLRAGIAEERVRAFGVATKVDPLVLPLGSNLKPLRTGALEYWIRKDQAEALIVCIGGHDDAWFSQIRQGLSRLGFIDPEADDARVVEAYALMAKSAWAERRPRLAAILFVDLDGGSTHAGMLARAWATAYEGRVLVGYWDPQQQPPTKPK